MAKTLADKLRENRHQFMGSAKLYQKAIDRCDALDAAEAEIADLTRAHAHAHEGFQHVVGERDALQSRLSACVEALEGAKQYIERDREDLPTLPHCPELEDIAAALAAVEKTDAE